MIVSYCWVKIYVRVKPVDVDNDDIDPPLACNLDILCLFNVNACIIVIHSNKNSNINDMIEEG